MSGANGNPKDGEAEVGTQTDEDSTDPSADLPEWNDEYIDEVAHRLSYNYDLEKDKSVAGESFDLYGKMELHSEKHMFHPSLSFAHHESHEHLFLRRVPKPTTTEINSLVEVGHDLADSWIDADEEHYSTEFTFVLVAPQVPDGVRKRVEALDERTLLKYGYNGHYDVHVAVVAPTEEDLVASEGADVTTALQLWEPIEQEEPGLIELIARRFQL